MNSPTKEQEPLAWIHHHFQNPNVLRGSKCFFSMHKLAGHCFFFYHHPCVLTPSDSPGMTDTGLLWPAQGRHL